MTDPQPTTDLHDAAVDAGADAGAARDDAPARPRPHRPRPDVDPAVLHPRVPPQGPHVPTRGLLSTDPVPLTDDESAALADLLDAGIDVLRAVARAAGVEPDTAERAIASLLAFVRRRITGEYEVDDLGFDPEFTDTVYLPLLRPVFRHWFRVEVRGIENIPSEGGALVVSNHSGTIAVDALMVHVALADEHPAHRRLRVLAADLVFATPFLGEMARRTGATLASNADAERLLQSGAVVGVWPEGFKGVGKPFSQRYRLQRFGRGGFVASALRNRVPIVPCAIVGAEEIYPKLGESPLLAKLFGLPYFPLTPTWPWLGLLGAVPLPTKWVIEFGEPVHTDEMDPALADDPMTVLDLSDSVRETIQANLYRLLTERTSVFRG